MKEIISKEKAYEICDALIINFYFKLLREISDSFLGSNVVLSKVFPKDARQVTNSVLSKHWTKQAVMHNGIGASKS